MEMDEEEVLIRDDSGLLHDDPVQSRRSDWYHKITKTLCLSLGFLVLGLCIAIPGPTLLDLGEKIHANTASMSLVFVARSVGYLLGSIIGGVLFDYFDKQLLLFCTLLVTSIATVAIPWSLTLVVMATMFSLQGVSMGILDTVGNVFCIRLWGKKSGPYMQTLHFAFGIGAFVAPLIAEPFLINEGLLNTTAITHGNLPVLTNVSPLLHNRSTRSDHFVLESIHNSAFDYGLENNFLNEEIIHRFRREHIDSTESTVFSTPNPTLAGGTTAQNSVPGSQNNSKSESEPAGNSDEVTDTDKAKQVNSDTVTSNSSINVNNTSRKSIPPKVGMTTTNSVTETTTTVVAVKHKKPSVANGEKLPGDCEDGNCIKKHIDDHKNEIIENAKSVHEDQSTTMVNPSVGTNKTNEQTVGQTNGTVNTDDKNSNNNQSNTSIANVTSGSITSVKSPDASNTGNIATDTNVTEPAKNNIETGTSTIASTQKFKNTSVSGQLTTKTAVPTTTTTVVPTTTTSIPTTTTALPTTTTAVPTTTTTTAVPTTTTKKPTTRTPASTTKPTTAATSTTKAIVASTEKPKAALLPAKPTDSKTEPPIKTSVKPPDDLPSSNPATASSSPANVSIKSDLANVTNPVTVQAVITTTTEPPTKPTITTAKDFINSAIEAVKNISKIQFAYLIIGLILFLNSLMFLMLYCKDKHRLSSYRDDETGQVKQGRKCFRFFLLIMLFFFFFCYVGTEVTFGGLVPTFAVKFNHWPKAQGAVVAAIFWGSLAAGRGFSIFIARCFSPTCMLVIDLILMILGGLVLSIGIYFQAKLLWLGTVILGLGMSSVFPTGISWAENHFHLTGKSTAVLVVGSALGEMVIPALTGYLFETRDGIVLMQMTLALSIVAMILFTIMQCFASGKGTTYLVENRDGFLPLQDEEDDMEIDIVHFDKTESRHVDRRRVGEADYHTLISDLEDD